MKNIFVKKIAFTTIAYFVASVSSLSAGFQDPARVKILTEGLPLHGSGLEIAPFHRPTLLKQEYNIHYADYTTASELKRKHMHLPNADDIVKHTVDLDFIWHPGDELINCIPNKEKFDYAISSHVIEHVPNVIGWLSQILEVIKTGGVLSLAVPDKRYTFDAYRPETHVNEMIDAWLRNQSIPSTAQIYDMLSNSADVSPGTQPYEEGIPFDTLHRNYTDQQALDFAIYAYTTGEYLDIHCSVFTPESLKNILIKLNDLGILNVFISEPYNCESEFFIRLTKLGEPKISRKDIKSKHPTKKNHK